MAFSCKGRGICPSCNSRRMAATAAHLTDHLISAVPVRQWGLSVPKRLRYFLHRDPKAAGAVLHILLRSLRRMLRDCSPGAGPDARFGAISFLDRFGVSLNPHFHYHLCVLDGVYEASEEEGVDQTPAVDPSTPEPIPPYEMNFYVAIGAGRRACLATRRPLGIPIPSHHGKPEQGTDDGQNDRNH